MRYHETPQASQGNAFTVTYDGQHIWNRPAPKPKRKAGRPKNPLTDIKIQLKGIGRQYQDHNARAACKSN